MLAEAEAGDGELPRGFTPPLVRVERLGDFGGRSLLAASVGEVEDGVDLGWRELEPLVGRKSSQRIHQRRVLFFDHPPGHASGHAV